MEEFKDKAKDITQHIPSKYQKEMGTKVKWYVYGHHSMVATIFALNIWANRFLWGYNCRIKISWMEKFMDLFPTLPKTTTKVLPNGEELGMDDTKFYQLFITGDLLTAFRARGTQAKKTVDRLEGLIPGSDDRHAQMALMKV